jgi:hypothetical protein
MIIYDAPLRRVARQQDEARGAEEPHAARDAKPAVSADSYASAAADDLQVD